MKDASAFQGLVDDLKSVGEETTTLAKAVEEKGEAIAKQAADEKGEGADKDDAEIAANAAEADAAKAKEEGEGEGEQMAKSYTLTLEDGTTVEAVDGGELVKSLINRLERNEAETKEALGTAVTVIKGQGELLKSMAAQIDMLSGQARPRKAVLNVTEKPAPAADLAKSEAPTNTINSEELMAKAMTAQAAGRVTGHDIAVAEQMIQMGQQPSDGFLRAVLAV